MKQDITEIEVNGVKYVPKDSVNDLSPAPKADGLEYVLVRTFSAGVHVGYLKERNGKEVQLLNARRLWSWSGANELSQLANLGLTDPSNSGNKFSVPSAFLTLTEAIEIHTVSAIAKKSIDKVVLWKR